MQTYRWHYGGQILVISYYKVALLYGAGGHVAEVPDFRENWHSSVRHADVQVPRRNIDICKYTTQMCQGF